MPAPSALCELRRQFDLAAPGSEAWLQRRRMLRTCTPCRLCPEGRTGREEWTASQLAQSLPVNASRISRQVAKMVGMGLMRRRRLRNDRRVVMLSLTAGGKKLTLDIQRRVHSYEAVL